METNVESNKEVLKQFEFDDEFEQQALAFLVRNIDFFRRNSQWMKAGYFVSDAREDIYRLASKYALEHEEPIPLEVLRQEIQAMYMAKKKKDVPIEIYFDLLADLFARKVESGGEYIEKKLLEHAKCQEKVSLVKKIEEDLIAGKNPTHIKVRKQGKEILVPITERFKEIDEIGIEEPPSELIEDTCISDYPKDAIQGWLKEFADLYSKHLESPYPFWVFNTATCLGNIVSARVRLNTALYVNPRLFTVCLGSSGDTRKSESGKQVTHFFEDWNEISGGWVGMSGWKGDGEESPKFFNLLQGCGSSEGLMDRLKHSPALVLIYDELRAFVQKSNIKGSNLLQVVNTLFEQNRVENATKDKFQQVKDAHLSLLAFCTTDTWDTLFTPSFLDIGFINRLWIVPGMGHKKDFHPEQIPENKKLNLMMKLTKLMSIFPPDTVIGFSQEADKRMQDWYLSFTRTDYTKRIENYGLRLLIIMAVSEGKKVIDLDMAERVITLLDWQVKVRQDYQPQDYTDTMSRIENLIRRAVKKNQWISEAVLLQKISARRFSSWSVDKAFESLITGKEIVRHFTARTTKYTVGEKMKD